MTSCAQKGIVELMKTTHDSSQASETKFAWRCYAIWWLDALALLVIMIIMSACRGFQDRRPQPSADIVESEFAHDLPEFSAV